jgi:dipeptidyl-peptidase-4
VVCILAGTVLVAQQPPAAAPPQLTVKAIFARGGLTGTVPQDVRFSPDGAKVSYLLRDDSGEHGQLWYVDVASGKKAVLVAEGKLASLAPAFDRLSGRERERRTRYSVAQYYWAPDSKHLLFDAFGQFWLYRLDTGTAVQVTSSPEHAGDPRFSPDGAHLAFIRKHNLYVAKPDGAGVRQLTNDSGDDVLNGEVDWVYAEELDARHHYFWSPDGRQILFLQMNESNVPGYPIADLIPTQPTVVSQAGRPQPPSPARGGERGRRESPLA